jgi:hypothetical protein
LRNNLPASRADDLAGRGTTLTCIASHREDIKSQPGRQLAETCQEVILPPRGSRAVRATVQAKRATEPRAVKQVSCAECLCPGSLR